MTDNEKRAKSLVESIKAFTEKPESLENFESYLSYHFDTWYQKFAGTADGLISEFEHFSKMYD